MKPDETPRTGQDQNNEAERKFAKLGATMNIKRAITALALTCTATMLMAHAMALPQNSSDSQERIPNGLRRMVQTLKNSDIVIIDRTGQICFCYIGEVL